MSAFTGHPGVGRTFPLYMSTTPVTIGANEYDHVIALLTGAATLNLPALASCPNAQKIIIRNNSAAPQTLTVQANGAEVIGAANTASVTQNQRLDIIVDHVHTKWQILYGPA